MSIDNEHQDQSVPKIIHTPEDVKAAVKSKGYAFNAFLAASGVKINTFQSWKRTDNIPNQSSLILFNCMISNVETYSIAMDIVTEIQKMEIAELDKKIAELDNEA